MNYKRRDIVLLPFPFVTTMKIKQKARPALVIWDHSISRRFEDLILAGITSQRIKGVIETEFLIDRKSSKFLQTGLIKTSVVRCAYLMTVPEQTIVRRLGYISVEPTHKLIRE
jgi:mRNA-degrading endonuclease toxin of MazEF toxin-antitoxin module